MAGYHDYSDLLRNNGQWAQKKLLQDPQFFEKLSEIQKAPFLYIGCSDSRVPIDTLTQTEPGELFIHRNIANQVLLTDMNLLSVVEYALEVLKVKHIIVCGHTECGGVTGAYQGQLRGLKENWTSAIKDLARANKAELEALPTERARLDRLAELNILAQVQNVFKISEIERLIEADGYYPQIHGWLLDIRSGLVKDLELPLDTWKAQGIIPQPYQPKRSL